MDNVIFGNFEVYGIDNNRRIEKIGRDCCVLWFEQEEKIFFKQQCENSKRETYR